MASNEELMRVYHLFTDCWKLYKTHADVQDTDRYWKKVIDESHAISRKYENDKFAIALILAVINEMERKAKESGDKDGQATGG